MSLQIHIDIPKWLKAINKCLHINLFNHTINIVVKLFQYVYFSTGLWVINLYLMMAMLDKTV